MHHGGSYHESYDDKNAILDFFPSTENKTSSSLFLEYMEDVRLKTGFRTGGLQDFHEWSVTIINFLQIFQHLRVFTTSLT